MLGVMGGLVGAGCVLHIFTPVGISFVWILDTEASRVLSFGWTIASLGTGFCWTSNYILMILKDDISLICVGKENRAKYHFFAISTSQSDYITLCSSSILL